MSEHTPGPWRINDHSRDEGCFYIEADHAGVASVFADEPAAGANARLISAAPDLLAALEHMVALFNSGAWSHANIKDARAALAKANP